MEKKGSSIIRTTIFSAIYSFDNIHNLIAADR